jgi:hypothetical protein
LVKEASAKPRGYADLTSPELLPGKAIRGEVGITQKSA